MDGLAACQVLGTDVNLERASVLKANRATGDAQVLVDAVERLGRILPLPVIAVNALSRQSMPWWALVMHDDQAKITYAFVGRRDESDRRTDTGLSEVMAQQANPLILQLRMGFDGQTIDVVNRQDPRLCDALQALIRAHEQHDVMAQAFVAWERAKITDVLNVNDGLPHAAARSRL